MNIQFDPFSFGIATFALAIAVMQLYWNRPQNHNSVRQECHYLLITSPDDQQQPLDAHV
jgi:hypothetical protein